MNRNEFAGYGVALTLIGLLFFFGYVMLLNTEVAKPQIQACYDAGGEPDISALNEFIACRGRKVQIMLAAPVGASGR